MKKAVCTALSTFVVAVLITFFVPTVYGAVLQGTVYDLESLIPLKFAFIDVNSEPEQFIITQDGHYFFTVGTGEYTIRAVAVNNKDVSVYAKKTVIIENDGNFTIDMIAFPASGTTELIEAGYTEKELAILNSISSQREPFSASVLTSFGLGIFVVLGALYFIRKRRKNSVQKQAHEEKKKTHKTHNLDKYAKEVVEILKKNENRLTQKELIGKISWFGEAKLSLVLSELENDGLIKKIKKGRGNIIILTEEIN